MRVFESRWSVWGASVVAVTLLLCLGIFLPWSAAEYEASASLGVMGSAHVDRGATGPEYPVGVAHLAVAPEEAEGSDKSPVNANLLTALLFMASFAVAAGWLLTYGRGPGIFGSWCVALRPHFLTARDDTSFLGVLRL